MGVLYVVATPIGNLEDISARASRILAEAGLILAEDTRHSKKLLNHLGISAPMQSCHDYNEREISGNILKRLQAGEIIALITDAGTPLISDPGFHLIKLVHENNIRVVPVPGACALITALSAAGLPTDRFVFEGFPPERQTARRKLLASLAAETRTMIFYESPHRIIDFLTDAISVFGQDRQVSLGRELTKKYETISLGSLNTLLQQLQNDENQRKGEFVVILRGITCVEKADHREAERILGILLNHSVSVREASAIAAEISGGKKNELYKRALALRNNE